MDAYQLLRKQAAQRRDDAFRAARAVFKTDIEQIAKLQRQLCGATPPGMRAKLKPLMALICELAPRDRTFTVEEIVRVIREAQPHRKVNANTVRTMFSVLQGQEALRRIDRGHGKVLWAVASYREAEKPYGAQSLKAVAADLLGELGPLRAAELVLTMQGRGYRSEDDRNTMQTTLETTLRRDKGTFRKDEAGKWAVAD